MMVSVTHLKIPLIYVVIDRKPLPMRGSRTLTFLNRSL
jgi:hypothetical protein